MSFSDEFENELQTTHIPLRRFQAVVHRLFVYGLIVAEDSEKERGLYTDAISCFRQLREWFSIAGFQLERYSTHRYIQLFPPQATIPGRDENIEEHPEAKRLNMNFNTLTAKVLLVLRALYEQRTAMGDMGDNAEVFVSIEDLITMMMSVFKTELPQSISERELLFRELRKQKAIRYKQSDAETTEQLLAIRPMILTLVNKALIETMLTSLTNNKVDDLSATGQTHAD